MSQEALTSARVMDPLWHTVSIYDGRKAFERAFEPLTPLQKTIFATTWLESEVCNGGFWQFFWNTTGVLAPEALEGLRTMRLDALADITRTAIDLFGPVYPTAVSTRRRLISKLPKTYADPDGYPPTAFDQLDVAFYAEKGKLPGGFEGYSDRFVADEAGREYVA